jgi:hypothetical protein
MNSNSSWIQTQYYPWATQAADTYMPLLSSRNRALLSFSPMVGTSPSPLSLSKLFNVHQRLPTFLTLSPSLILPSILAPHVIWPKWQSDTLFHIHIYPAKASALPWQPHVSWYQAQFPPSNTSAVTNGLRSIDITSTSLPLHRARLR